MLLTADDAAAYLLWNATTHMQLNTGLHQCDRLSVAFLFYFALTNIHFRFHFDRCTLCYLLRSIGHSCVYSLLLVLVLVLVLFLFYFFCIASSFVLNCIVLLFDSFFYFPVLVQLPCMISIFLSILQSYFFFLFLFLLILLFYIWCARLQVTFSFVFRMDFAFILCVEIDTFYMRL